MPRSSRTGELQYDPEIEKTAKHLRKQTKASKGKSSRVGATSLAPEPSLLPELDLTIDPTLSSSESEKEEIMAEAERTLRELTAPDLNQQPLCITYPDIEVGIELKSGLIHLLPTFRGLENEDPHKHLKEFHIVCSSMRPRGVSEEQTPTLNLSI